MAPNALGLARFLRNRLSPRRGLAEAAVETVVLQPAEVEHIRPLIFLPGQIEKATAAVPGHASLADEVAIARNTKLLHAPVIRHTLEKCLVHPAGVDFRGGSLRKKGVDFRSLVSGNIRRLSDAIYCMSGVSHEYFGHWLQDACAAALLQREGEALLLDVRPDWPHAREYMGALSLEGETSPLQLVERLSVYQDHGQGSHKRRRYADMRRRLDASFGVCSTGAPLVYFRRGGSGAARIVANEAEVIAALVDQGFEVFDLNSASAREIFIRFRDARAVVSMDGSHLNHLYLSLPRDATLLTLVPADRFTMNQVGYAAAAGLRYGFVVVEPKPEGYFVSTSDLLATLRLALHA